MGISTELSLLLIGLALYLTDSVCLLYSNEGVLIAARDTWRISLGSDHLLLAGKNLFLLPPLNPSAPVFRLLWPGAQGVDSRALAMSLRNRASALRFLLPQVFVQFVAMFIVVPFCLLRFPGIPLLVALAFLYVNALCALAFVAIRRKSLELPWKSFTSIAIECLICIPFSINLLRKLSLRIDVPGDMVTIARELLPATDYQHMAEVLSKRVEEAIEYEEEGTERYLDLVRLRDELIGKSA